MAKKRISAEERKEFKGGKYMGGPAEEKAEKKKKKPKRMALGGLSGYGGTNTNDPVGRGGLGGTGNGGVSGGLNGGGQGRGGPAGGVTTGTTTGTSASNRPGREAPVMQKPMPALKPKQPVRPMPKPAAPRPKLRPDDLVGRRYGDVTDDMLPGGRIEATPEMVGNRDWGQLRGQFVDTSYPNGIAGGWPGQGRGGGVPGNGDRQRFKAGGLVKGCGCASRGTKKTKYR